MDQSKEFKQAIAEANRAAERAAQDWLQNAESWFPCGNANLIADKGSSFGIWLRRNGADSYSGGYLVPVVYSQRSRQEHGMHVAAVNAAQHELVKHGIVTRIWEYID
jgi:hypothetical protein